MIAGAHQACQWTKGGENAVREALGYVAHRPEPSSARVGDPDREPISDRDVRLLEFAAEHRIVLASQVGPLLGVSTAAAYERLRALTAAGLLTTARPFTGPACYRIARGGLGAIGSDLRTPRPVDHALYAHDIGVGWLWIAAHKGVWGEISEVISERRMRSHDATADAAAGRTYNATDAAHSPGSRFGIRLGGVGRAGRDRRHYPDLLLVTEAGHRIAVELELSSKGRARRETIVAGYAADPRIDAVLYLVDRPAVGRALSASAARLGVSDLVHVQRVRWGADAPPSVARTTERSRERRRSHASTRQAGVER
jgi:hypothetical protein